MWLRFVAWLGVLTLICDIRSLRASYAEVTLLRGQYKQSFDLGYNAHAMIRVVIVLFIISCAGATNMQRIPAGLWGGDHIRIDVGAKSATVEYDCAHGVIQGPLTVDSQGRFKLHGTHTPERGGPVRAGESARSEQATYTGSISGDKMTLTLQLANAEDETFTLEKDKQGELFKCK